MISGADPRGRPGGSVRRRRVFEASLPFFLFLPPSSFSRLPAFALAYVRTPTRHEKPNGAVVVENVFFFFFFPLPPPPLGRPPRRQGRAPNGAIIPLLEALEQWKSFSFPFFSSPFPLFSPPFGVDQDAIFESWTKGQHRRNRSTRRAEPVFFFFFFSFPLPPTQGVW